MLEWFWNSIAAQVGFWALLAAVLAAAGWLFPPFRRWLWGLAGIIAAGLSIYGKGVRDASRKADEKRKADEARAIQRGRDARARAERDVADGVRDKFDRDNI